MSDINSKPQLPSKKFTSDFNSMINIITLNSLGMFFFQFLIPFVVSQEIEAKGIEMGVLFSMNIIGYMLSSPFVGIVIDRGIKRRFLILLGSFGRAFAYVILFISILLGSLIGLLIGMFFIGFFVSFYWIPLDTLISDKSSKFHRSLAFGLRDANIGKGSVIGAFIGFSIFAYAVSFDNPNPLFVYSPLIIYCLANIWAGLLFVFKVDESLKFDNFEQDNHNIQKNFIPSALIIGIALLVVTLFLGAINGSLAKPFLIVYLLENLTNDPNLAVFVYLPGGVLSIYLAPRLGKFADKINPYLGITGFSILGAIITLFLVNTYDILFFTLLLTIDMSIVSAGALIIQNFLSRISKSHRGKIFGFRSTFDNLGAIIGPILGGIIWDTINQKTPFYLSIGVELFLIPFFLLAILLVKPFLEESTEGEAY